MVEVKKTGVEKQKSSGQNSWFSGLIIGILIVGFIWWFTSDSETGEDVEFCVESCVNDMDLCVFTSEVYDVNRNAFIPGDDYEDCALDLESCIGYCSTP